MSEIHVHMLDITSLLYLTSTDIAKNIPLTGKFYSWAFLFSLLVFMQPNTKVRFSLRQYMYMFEMNYEWPLICVYPFVYPLVMMLESVISGYSSAVV